jgi:hypothetical protein
MHRAGAAKPCPAAVFRAGQPDMIADDIKRGLSHRKLEPEQLTAVRLGAETPPEFT